MDIKSLNNAFIRSNDTDRIAREKTSDTSGSKPQSSASGPKDSLLLGATRYADETDFARSVLQNLREQSVDQLRSIKARMDSGFYSSDEFVGSLSEQLVGSLSDALFAGEPSGSRTVPSTLTQELQTKLLNDEEVLSRISSRLLDDLSNL